MTTTKTSRSHPLRVGVLAIEGLSGVIGLTFCPGKKQRGASSGDWDRDLGADLEAIKSSGAKALVTLMEDKELTAVQVPLTELGEKAASLGLEWHHLPIRDVDVPDEHFEDQLAYSGTRSRELLIQGKKIVIHCLGGLGHSDVSICGGFACTYDLFMRIVIRLLVLLRIGEILHRDCRVGGAGVDLLK